MQLLNMVPLRNLAGLTTLRSEFDPEKNWLFTKESVECRKSWSVTYRSVKCELGHVTSTLLEDVTLVIVRH